MTIGVTAADSFPQTLSSNLIAQAFAAADAAIAIFTADRRYLSVNHRFAELTGYTPEEIRYMRAGESLRLSPLKQDEFMRLVTSAISTGEADILRKDGSLLAIEYIVLPTVINGEGHFIGMLWPLVDHHDWGRATSTPDRA